MKKHMKSSDGYYHIAIKKYPLRKNVKYGLALLI